MFKVTRGQKYLFRVIGTGALYPWRISVDQHNLTMVAVDGFDITPVVAESFIIAPGESSDCPHANGTKTYQQAWP
jgi:FtsP/CotA-like multicopper oxidase with cupredoxin domain